MTKRHWVVSIAIVTLLMAAQSMMFAAGQQETDDTITLGIVSITANDSSNARYIASAKEAAAEYGWDVIVVDANGSADEANAAMQNLSLRGVDAIIDLVFPVTSIGAGLRAAEESGVVVGTWGGGLGENVAATNGSGGIQAQPIVEQMVADMGGEGSVLALTYHAGQVARDRELILDGILEDYPDIDVTKNEVRIPGYVQDGAEFASAWLSGHPKDSEPLAIWGSWDDPALGAISAMRQQGRDDVKVYGQNGNIDAIVAVKEGWMTATAWAPVEEEARVMVETLKEAMEAGDSWEPKAVEVPVIVVNQDTIDEFLEAHPEADGE